MTKREIQRWAKEIIEDGIEKINNGRGEIYENEDGEKIVSVFLGTVFQIFPSGKYYTPWARSNLEPCPQCRGKGCNFCGNLGSREAFEDQLFYEELERQAEKYNAWITNGEGDPCDIFLEKYTK
ncbi:MAG: hypothetical protein DRO05_00590 [Thermoproteota archaeon]|nr:MAG: hypothetical protein DRO05_00590 [Candidatus Korarchaeota archaeon]